MNIISKRIILFLTALCMLYSNSYGETSFSGNISTVDPRSGFNALRNPALMSFREKNDISLSYIYSYLAHSETEGDVSVGGVPFSSDISSGQDYDGAFIFSAVNHSGGSSYGIGISKGSEGQVKFTSSESEIENLGVKFITNEEKSDFGTGISLSYSWKLNSNESLGIQLETSILYESLEKNNKTYNPALSENKDVEITRNRITSGLTLGYYFSGKEYDFGAGFKTGRYGFENREYSYSEKISMAENDSEISDYFMQDEGIGFIGGFNIKPTPRFSYAVEAGVSLPYTRKEKVCNDDAVTLEKSDNEVNIMYGYGAKGGVTYRAGNIVTFSAGGSYLRFKSSTMGEDNVRISSMLFNIYQVTAGADFKASENLNFIAGLNYNCLMGELETDTSSVSMKVEPVSHTIDFMAGITLIY